MLALLNRAVNFSGSRWPGCMYCKFSFLTIESVLAALRCEHTDSCGDVFTDLRRCTASVTAVAAYMR